jgi:hypothetical protein
MTLKTFFLPKKLKLIIYFRITGDLRTCDLITNFFIWETVLNMVQIRIRIRNFSKIGSEINSFGSTTLEILIFFAGPKVFSNRVLIGPLLFQPHVEKQAVDWIRWLVREEAYFESESGCAARQALLYSSHEVLRIRIWDPVPF